MEDGEMIGRITVKRPQRNQSQNTAQPEQRQRDTDDNGSPARHGQMPPDSTGWIGLDMLGKNQAGRLMEKKIITAIPFAGVGDFGHAVLWSFRFQDGTEQEFRCPQELLSQFVQGLMLAGQAAEKARSVQPGTLIEISHLHRATAVQSGRSGQDVVLRFATETGVPVDLSMHPNVGLDTIQQIGKALAMPVPKPESRN